MPIPSLVFLMVAGALLLMDNARERQPLAVIACLTGNCIWPWYGPPWALALCGRRAGSPPIAKLLQGRHKGCRCCGLPLVVSRSLLPEWMASWRRLSTPKSVTRELPCARSHTQLTLISFLFGLDYVFKSARACHSQTQYSGTALAIAIGVPIVFCAG